MPEYRLDDLHWSEFESLCQALLKAELGVGVEAWGGSGDWGNDAYCQAPLRYPGSELQEGPFQFQVKFVQGANAAGARPRTPLLNAVRQECQRIEKRCQPIPRVYSLLSNIVFSPQLRKKVEGMIQHAISDKTAVVVHGGNDICAWLHTHDEIRNKYPQLLSYRDFVALVTPPSQLKLNKVTKKFAKTKLSSELKEKKKQARIASRKHNIDSALDLWNKVCKQAKKEDNKLEVIKARLKIILILVRDEHNPNDALKLANKCHQETKSIDLGKVRPQLLHMTGEIYRIKGNQDQARGFFLGALEDAKANESMEMEGLILLSLSALEKNNEKNGNNNKALELINQAYNAYSMLNATGDKENQKNAKYGFAQCHCWRAEIYDYARPDDALAEWTLALGVFKELGEEHAWESADTLLKRANLRERINDSELAFIDISEAAKIYHQFENTSGTAKCHRQLGELLDSVGKRSEAAKQYQQAASIAATWGNERKAAYYYFRHACKLVETHEYKNARDIFSYLASSDWLEKNLKLTVISQLCLVAQATRDDEELKENCSVALALVDDLIQEATNPEDQRALLIKKGHHLEQFGLHEQAIKCYKNAIRRFEAIGDEKGVIECWFHIRGVMQHLGRNKEEQEACETVLALGAEKTSPMFAALALVSLAQINIREQHYSEATQQLKKAEGLDPDNPVVRMLGADLQSKLPKLTEKHLQDADSENSPPGRNQPSLIRELHEWCTCYPQKQKAILPLWYYIHRKDLWEIFQSMLGVKFLICSAKVVEFDQIRKILGLQGDLFAWGTNFGMKTKQKVELIPVPKGFIYPAGITVVSARESSANSQEKTNDLKRPETNDTKILTPVSKPENKPYYLAYMKNVVGYEDGSPFFAGQKRRLDPKIASFMLKSNSHKELVSDNSICLSLNEHKAVPKLKHTMKTAWENGAIPVFWKHLPHNGSINCVCDSMFNLPTKSIDTALCSEAKALWEKLLSSCSETPKPALKSFTNEVKNLFPVEAKDWYSVRIYLLSFQYSGHEVIHPGVVIQS